MDRMTEDRSRQERDNLERIFRETLEIIQKEPMRLVKITGGNVPHSISNIQVIVSGEVIGLAALVLQWARGENNGVDEAAQFTLNKLKEVSL